jgi:two-component sensor histidine kinase
MVGSAKIGDFFTQARSLIEEGARGGDITEEQAAELRVVLERVEQESGPMDTEPWPSAELRRVLPANILAPRVAREAVAFVAPDIPEHELQTARLLVSELVANSVRYGGRGRAATVELLVGVERSRLRVEVADDSPVAARLKPPSDEGGYGLALVEAMASRWGAGLQDGRNVTWFELDLPLPGRSRF